MTDMEQRGYLNYMIFRSDGKKRHLEGLRPVLKCDKFDRVHTLILEDGTEIHMLAEKKYPLTKETLERMMSLKLIAEDSAYDLLRFIQKQIDEAGSHDGGEKDL
ncbi:hypothetical protein Tco_0725122 [Tanacetum coccineum]|uniref:Uncharacterized protein n=1 Tax=Tanacetum coccineum TaxID=301880 RepID=A0ABQ4YE57_9ASTR